MALLLILDKDEEVEFIDGGLVITNKRVIDLDEWKRRIPELTEEARRRVEAEYNRINRSKQ